MPFQQPSAPGCVSGKQLIEFLELACLCYSAHRHEHCLKTGEVNEEKAPCFDNMM